MPYVQVGYENTGSIEIYYEDHGSGRPVLLGHGYPFDRQAWEKQVPALLATGHRVITYDQRGWGRSSRPAAGYDYDTAASDIHLLIDSLDLRDLALIGHSTGTGVVTRYLRRQGSARVDRVVLIAPLPPKLVRGSDNPAGIAPARFNDYVSAARADRYAWLAGFLHDAFNMDAYAGTLISSHAFQASFNAAARGSSIAAADCIASWQTDFHADLPSLDVPTLILHGDRDRILPIELTGSRLPGLLGDAIYEVIQNGPNGLIWTHADQVNRALHNFLK